MNDALFEKLTKSLREEKAILAGTLQGRKTVLAREHPAAVRARLGKTQEEFAAMIGVPLGTLRNWEQGHRTPAGPAKALLTVAAKYPEEIADALADAARAVKQAARDVVSTARREAGRHFIKGTNSAKSSSTHPRDGRASLIVHSRSGRVRDRQHASAR